MNGRTMCGRSRSDGLGAESEIQAISAALARLERAVVYDGVDVIFDGLGYEPPESP